MKPRKTKHCPLCKLDLPLESFTSTRAKYCKQCKRIRELEQAQERQQRAITRLKNKKQKTQTKVTLAERKKQVQRVVNKYIRLRDADDGCISCGNKNASSYDAGHYINQGSSGALRYNLDNIHKQCSFKCNHNLSGNKIEYRINLVKKIGLEEVEWLEKHRHDTHRYTREELDVIEEMIKTRLKSLER